MEKCTLKSLIVGDKIKTIDKVKRGLNRKNSTATKFGILASTILKDNDKMLKVVEEVACHSENDLTHRVSTEI